MREVGIVQNAPNSAEINSEEQTGIGSSNVQIIPEDPTDVQSNFTFNLHVC